MFGDPDCFALVLEILARLPANVEDRRKQSWYRAPLPSPIKFCDQIHFKQEFEIVELLNTVSLNSVPAKDYAVWQGTLLKGSELQTL